MREDMSDFLIHFTKGDDLEDAYLNLNSIIENSVIQGSNALIKGDSNCVCFSEAPLSSLKNGLLNETFYSRYSPFGILTTKEHIFSIGGRPVIYQPDSEFCQLSAENSWRHMRYDPPSVDFTWEREWRLKSDGYHFNSENAQIIVPDESWEQRLVSEHDAEQKWQTLQYSEIMDELAAIQHEEPHPWRVIPLN